MSDVSCTVVDSYDHIDHALEKEWDELAILTRGSIYLTCAWSRIWWEFYGKKKTLRIYFYRSNDKLVGVIPIYIEEIRIWFVKTRVARLVGAYNPPRVFDLPIIKEYAAAIGEHMARHLVGTDRCDLISIGPVADECEAKKALFAAVGKMTNDLGIVRDIPFGVYTYFDLPDTYEAYTRSLSQNNRKKCRRCWQNLMDEKNDFSLVELHKPDEIEAEMPQFIALHAAQWQPQGRPGYFGAWPQSDAFNHRLAIQLARFCRSRLIKISVGNQPILYECSYIFGDCCYWQISARVDGEEWDRFSLGVTGALVVIRKAIDERIKRIEGGVSHYDYKMRLGATESNISVMRATARRSSSMAKYYFCKALHKMYLNIYFKLWYSRIQPKLPSIFHRPISMTYIRMTF